MKLANIVVDIKTNFDLPFFTYKIPPALVSELKIGQLVRLPFGKKMALGYVVGFVKQTEILLQGRIKEFKEITEIVSNEPVLLPYQIKLAFWMAKYYHTPVINCIKLMLPPALMKLRRESYPERTRALEVDASTGTRSPILYGTGERRADRRDVGEQASGYPTKAILHSKQTLILVPTVDKIPDLVSQQKITSEDISIYHNRLTETKRYDVWQKVYDGSVQTVVGTRLALFLPLQNLTKIVIKKEEDQNFIEKRSPYYHIGKVAQKLVGLLGISLVFESETPSLESFFKYKDYGNIKFITKTSGKFRANPVKIIDLGDEKNRRKNLISSQLKDVLKKSYDQTVLIFCFSNNEKSRVREELKMQFTKIPSSFTVSTSPYPISCASYAVVILANVDTLLNLPNFRAAEKTFQTIWQLQKLVAKDGLFLIQSYNPKHPAITFAIKQDYQSFYKSELAERKLLFYPPFSVIAKLTFFAKKERTAALAAEKLRQVLENATKSDERPSLKPLTPITILGPVSNQNLSGTFKYSIILKAKTRADLEPFLAIVPRNWNIYIDPQDLR